MFASRTKDEAQRTLILNVDTWVLEGFSGTDACRIVGRLMGVDADALHEVWLDYRINLNMAMMHEV